LREWLERGEKEDEWEGIYLVDFIGTDGYPDHDHVEEPGIQPFEGDIPENLGFLLTLSDHYRGKRTIKQSVFDELFTGKIFVERVRTFTEDDFER